MPSLWSQLCRGFSSRRRFHTLLRVGFGQARERMRCRGRRDANAGRRWNLRIRVDVGAEYAGRKSPTDGQRGSSCEKQKGFRFGVAAISGLQAKPVRLRMRGTRACLVACWPEYRLGTQRLGQALALFSVVAWRIFTNGDRYCGGKLTGAGKSTRGAEFAFLADSRICDATGRFARFIGGRHAVQCTCELALSSRLPLKRGVLAGIFCLK